MKQQLIDLFLERVKSDKLEVASKVTLYDAMTNVVEFGNLNKVHDDTISAALVAFGLLAKYNARVDLNQLQQAASPPVTRLAILYSSQLDIWQAPPPLSQERLKQLRIIDVAHAVALGGPRTDAQRNFIREQGLTTVRVEAATRDLNHKVYTFLRDETVRTKAGYIFNLRDPQVLLHIARLAVLDGGQAWMMTGSGDLLLVTLTKAEAAELVLELNSKLDKMLAEREAAAAQIEAGTYSFSFQFTKGQDL